jgi:nitrite reductase/ring-hydroxylating ferredoxin subunit
MHYGDASLPRHYLRVRPPSQPNSDDTLECVLVRSDNEAVVVNLDICRRARVQDRTASWSHAPCHGSQFDIATGAVLRGPAKQPLATYDVREQNGEIEVRL